MWLFLALQRAMEIAAFWILKLVAKNVYKKYQPEIHE